MRFDDSLTTVLAAESASANGAQAAWRQLVDLTGRGRVADLSAAVDRLVELRPTVPTPIRAASARALAFARPPAALVAFFAADELAVAAPVLRIATLDAAEWLALLPRLTPAARAVLRHRRDLPDEVARGLAAFGATDFVLAHDAPAPTAAAATPPPRPAAPLDETPFVSVAQAARAIPAVAEALGQAAEAAPRYEIADLMARIDAFQRARPDAPPAAAPASAPLADRFEFATDADGVIRWIDGVPRGPLIGASLARTQPQGVARFDAIAGGALRGRAAFRDARLEVTGGSAAAGAWRLAAEPVFDRATGRFAGMRGIGRRPAAHEIATAVSASDQLRQLIHELRTPLNAIAGFAELIGSELLGSVVAVHRDRAAAIQRQAADLLAAIEDLDTAARIEGDALELRPGQIDLAALVRRAAGELGPLVAESGAVLAVEADAPAPALADERAATRLVTRLLATVIAAAQPGERLRAQVTTKTRTVRLNVTRPRALVEAGENGLLAIDGAPDGEGAPLLGAGFTLRLLRNLAGELGGRLAIEDERLTLRLPAALGKEVERAAAQ